jgi:hypothetical protein
LDKEREIEGIVSVAPSSPLQRVLEREKGERARAVKMQRAR